MTRLVESLSTWDDVEGRPFTLGSFRYQEDVLSVIQEELTLMDRIKPKKPVRFHGLHAVMTHTTVYTCVSISHPELVTTKQSAADENQSLLLRCRVQLTEPSGHLALHEHTM